MAWPAPLLITDKPVTQKMWKVSTHKFSQGSLFQTEW